MRCCEQEREREREREKKRSYGMFKKTYAHQDAPARMNTGRNSYVPNSVMSIPNTTISEGYSSANGSINITVVSRERVGEEERVRL